MKYIFLNLIFLFIKEIHSEELSDLFCGCEVCCTIQKYNPSSDLFFTYSPASQLNYSVHENNIFDMVMAEMNRPPRNLMIITGTEEINCTQSIAYAYDESNMISYSNLIQDSINTCYISFDEQLTPKQLNDGWNLFIGFRNLTKSHTKIFIVNGDVIKYPTSHSVYNIMTLSAESDPIQNGALISLNLTTNPYVDDSECIEPPSVDYIIDQCNFTSNYHDSIFDFTLLQNKYNECSSNVYYIDDSVVFEFDVQIQVDIPSCFKEQYNSIQPVNNNNGIQFNITINNSVNTYTNNTIEHTTLSIYDQHSIPCSGRLTHMGKLGLTLNASSSVQSIKSVSCNTASIGDIPFNIDYDNIVCSEEPDNTHSCSLVLTSNECLSMHSVGNNCRFSYLDSLDISCSVIFQDNTIQTVDIMDSERTIQSLTYDNEFCSVTLNQVDVTDEFNVQMNVSGTNINQNIISSIFLSDFESSASTSIVIQDITVKLVDKDTSLSFLRHFDIDDKIDLIGHSTIPYYNDAHFCRFHSNNQCSSFYQQNTSRWNDWLQQNSDNLFQNDFFSLCQSPDSLFQDRFIFNPSNWIFNQYSGWNAYMEIDIIASVVDCSTHHLRRLERSANQDEPLKVVSLSSSFNVTNNTTNNEPDDNHHTEIAIGATGSILSIIGIASLIFCFRKQKKKKSSSTHTHNDLNVPHIHTKSS